MDDVAVDVVELHTRAVRLWLDRVRTVPADAWGNPTPCAEWDVRELVNHIVGEERWTVPLLAGRTIEDVGSELDGDLLGPEPVDAAEQAAQDTVAAFEAPGARDRTVHLSFGDTPAQEYAWQLFADHLVHAWDLAVATGGDTTLDDDLVEACAGWWKDNEEMYRSGGAISDRAGVGADASAQDLLLASFGRDPRWSG